MRMVFRDKKNSDYWEERWENSGVDENGFKNQDMYPIKYANEHIKDGDKILEAGCGAGRVYFHYKQRGFDIKGIEYSKSAVKNIQKKDPNSEVIEGSVSDMPYNDNSFDSILAFGLYHNLENKRELQKAFNETKRVLKQGGAIVASVRFDSLENNIVENIIKKRSGGKIFEKFHRWHFSLEDIVQFLGNDMNVEKVYYARNVSFLFKYDIFREKSLKASNFQESKARSSGFELNLLGTILDDFLHNFFPKKFSNLLIVVARKT
jgi:ubiquinone/menaquinone biosynthesis C-methylase UbiE